jgi:Transmembrane secretion effector
MTASARTTPDSGNGRHSPLRSVAPLWASVALSSIGDGAFIAAGPLLAAFLTRDPMAVAIVSVAGAAPWFTVGVFAGAWVDRLPRRRVLIVSEVVRGIGLALLALLVVLHHASIAALAAAWFLITAGRTFFDAAAQAVLPQLVGREGSRLAQINGRLFATETVGESLAGPPLGGLLFGLAPWAPFAVDAASFAGSAAVLAALPPQPAPVAVRPESVTVAVRTGFRYLVHDRQLLTLSGATAGYNVAYNVASATLVLFALDSLHVSNSGYGFLLAAGALGAVVAGWRARPLVARLGTTGAVLVSLAAQALGWLSVLVAPNGWLAAPGFAVLGAASTLITIAVVSERQQSVPDHLLGRVVSAFRLVGNGFASLGGITGGAIAVVGGPRLAIVAAPVLLVLTGLFLGARFWRQP